jgi:hypothetical protein
MPIACWITKATDTHSEYTVLLAFPRRRHLSVRFIRTLPVFFYVFSASNTHWNQQTGFTQALLPTNNTFCHFPLEPGDHLGCQKISLLSEVSRSLIAFKTPSLIIALR